MGDFGRARGAQTAGVPAAHQVQGKPCRVSAGLCCLSGRTQHAPFLDAFSKQGRLQEDVRERGLSVQPGHAARDALFMLDPEVAYLNHGSFGASFR